MGMYLVSSLGDEVLLLNEKKLTYKDRLKFMEPVTAIAAAKLTELAFNEFIKSGAGEIAKKTVGGAIDLVKNLRDKIKAKFKGNERAEKALAEVEQQGSSAALDKVTKHLDLELDEDEAFATEVRQIAQQIINIQNQNNSSREYNNYGRDQINIENMQGNQKIGGA